MTDKIRDQQDLFKKKKCAFREEVTRLKALLEEGNKVRKKYKEKEETEGTADGQAVAVMDHVEV